MIDELDRIILKTLQKNARTSYAEIAKQAYVSPATIHVRVEKMKEKGIIEGTEVKVNATALGFDICAFIGVRLKQAGDYKQFITQLETLPEVTEAYYTTGLYSVFVKIQVPSIRALHLFLSERLQTFKEVQSTETFISLEQPIQRPLTP